MQSQLTRPYGHDQAEEPIRIHYPEEEEHHEKGASKVLKKVKEKAKKIKNTLTKNGHGHEHDHDVDEEDDEYDEPDPEVHGAPVYESSAVRGGVTGQAGETNIPAPEEIIPPGTKVFPVVSTDHTKPIEPEPLQDTLYGHEAVSHPVRTTDTSDKEERREEAPIHHPFRASDLTDREESREAHHEPMNTPLSLLSTTEDVTRTFAPGGEDEDLGGQRKVNIEMPIGLEEDPAAPGGGGSDDLSGVSNYQSKVTDPTKEGGGEVGVPKIAQSLGRMKVTDESPDQETGPGLEKDSLTRSDEFDRQSESGTEKDSPKRFVAETGAELGKDFPTRSHEFDQKNESETGKDSPARFGKESGAALGEDFSTTELKRDLPTGTHDQFSPELSRPKERDDFEETTHETKPITYTEKLALATSPITEKAIAAKDAVACKLGYSGESGGGGGGKYESTVRDEAPRSDTGYGQNVAGTVAEKLTPVYEKVKETGSNVMTKLPLSGGGSGVEETQQGEGKGVSARDYISGKLRPGEGDKALSEVIAEKLHLGGGGGEKKITRTKEMEVTVEKIPTEKVLEEKEHGEMLAEEGKGGGGGGMAGKIKGAVTSWLGGTKPKSPHSVEESSQSLGSTVGTTGFSDSGGSELTGETGVGSGAVPVQRGLGN